MVTGTRRRSMPRFVTTVGALLAALAGVSSSLRGQRIGEYNDARLLSTVSAAALGQSAGISLGLSSTSLTYSGRLAFGDLPLGPGALRLVAGHPKNFEGYSVGYAAPLARGTLSTFASTTVGAELSVGYLGYRLGGPTAYIGNGTYLNAHLALPVGIQVGDADRLSFAPYVAPYADL